jgi:hypothetical protein
MISSNTCKVRCSGLDTFIFTSWSGLAVQRTTLAVKLVSPLSLVFLLTVEPDEAGFQVKLSLVLRGVLLPERSQMQAWIG